MKIKHYLPILFLALSADSYAQHIKGDLPLFHIARSVNTSIVCYDAHFKDGTLDTKSPIHVFWRGWNEEGVQHENEINFIQRKMAYGYTVVKSSTTEATVRLNAYKKRDFRLFKHKGEWIISGKINGVESQLTQIYVKNNPKNALNVIYVDLIGKSLSDGSEQRERVKNSEKD